jgi:hypothetical protein
LIVERRKDGLLRIPHIPYEIRKTSYSFKIKFGEVYKSYDKFSFIKEKAYKEQAEFIAPGHPLLEAVVEKVLERYREELEKGAIFIDPSGNMEGLIWFLECEIKDGSGQIAGKRIFALFQDRNGSIRQISPSILWDLKPASGELPEQLSQLQASDEQVVIFAAEEIISKYLEELKKQRERDAEIKRKYGLRSLDELIFKSEEKLLDYETRRAKGENIPEVTIQNENQRKEDLLMKKKRLEDEIKGETNLLPSMPKILGIAAVKPVAMLEDALKEDLGVEKIGMQIAMEFEQKQGRVPEDVSMQNLGFDIRSTSIKEVRYIEVKARAKSGRIALTTNEWLMANRLEAEYWLYIVENATSKPELYIIQNPAKNLKPDEEIEVVRYIVSDWKPAARKVL